MPYFVTRDHCKLYYEEKGEGKAVVFVHGWSCNRHFFQKQVPEFLKKYKVLSYDLRGHGDSDRTEYGNAISHFARDLKELIDFRDLKDVTLIGWSMGVYIIFDYILQFGCDNLAKIVLLDMTSKMVTDENWTYGLFGEYPLQTGVDYLEEITIDWPAVAAGFVPAMFDDDYPIKEEIDYIYAEALKNTPHVMVNMWLSLIQKDYRAMLSTITVPALITYGSSKSLYEPECSEYIQENIPNASIAAFKGGHIHFFEDPENFNKTVMDFIG